MVAAHVVAPYSVHGQHAPSEHYPPEVQRQFQDVLTGKVSIDRMRPIEIRYPHPFYPEEWVSDRPITVHLRGTSGTPLPAPRRRIETAEWLALRAQAEEYANRQIQRNADEIDARYKNLPALPPCGKDARRFRDFDKPTGDGLYTDILFIDPGQMPSDPQEAFGAKTRVVEYDREKKSPDSFLVYTFKIRCLPSRHRVLARGVSDDEGVPALKNYDTDLYGAGTLHESMRNRAGRLFDEAGNSL